MENYRLIGGNGFVDEFFATNDLAAKQKASKILRAKYQVSNSACLMKRFDDVYYKIARKSNPTNWRWEKV